MNTNLRESIWTSYVIGLPAGLLTILIVFLLPGALTGEGLATMAMVAIYGKAIWGLIIAFIVSLWLGATIAHKNILKHKSLLTASIKYSLTINLIIWTVFAIITYLEDKTKYGTRDIYLPILIAFLSCSIITPVTIGLFICYRIKEKINNHE